MSSNLFNIIFREAIGYDVLSRFGDAHKVDNYPPHNITKQGDTYHLTLAVAGFTRDELEVTVDNGHLSIQGIRGITESPDNLEILHKGLAFRDFDRSWKLGEYVEVVGVSLENGLLTVELQQLIPESKKARKIDIS